MQHFKKRVDAVTQGERDVTKKLVYAIMYGGGPKKIAEELGVDETTARSFVQAFYTAFPGVPRFFTSVVQDCRNNGGVVMTLAGRKRILEGILVADPALQHRAANRAKNTTCQGSAADLMRIAMIRLSRSLQELSQKLPPDMPKPSILLQIHDEILVETPSQLVECTARIVQGCMECAADLQVPLPVEISVGDTWGCLTPLHLTSSPHLLESDIFDSIPFD